jgi:hypothetical protein
MWPFGRPSLEEESFIDILVDMSRESMKYGGKRVGSEELPGVDASGAASSRCGVAYNHSLSVSLDNPRGPCGDIKLAISTEELNGVWCGRLCAAPAPFMNSSHGGCLASYHIRLSNRNVALTNFSIARRLKLIG